jgi:hypothetical protein
LTSLPTIAEPELNRSGARAPAASQENATVPTTTKRATIDPGEFALSAEGVGLAEELAAHTFAGLIDMTNIARLDTTITGLFLLAETLAALEVYAEVSAGDALRCVSQMTAERVLAIRADPPEPPTVDFTPPAERGPRRQALH